MSNALDVHALLIEISILPTQALSMRTCATRLPPESTTAMFIGWPISSAFFSAAAIIRLASASVTIISPPGKDYFNDTDTGEGDSRFRSPCLRSLRLAGVALDPFIGCDGIFPEVFLGGRPAFCAHILANDV